MIGFWNQIKCYVLQFRDFQQRANKENARRRMVEHQQRVFSEEEKKSISQSKFLSCPGDPDGARRRQHVSPVCASRHKHHNYFQICRELFRRDRRQDESSSRHVRTLPSLLSIKRVFFSKKKSLASWPGWEVVSWTVNTQAVTSSMQPSMHLPHHKMTMRWGQLFAGTELVVQFELFPLLHKWPLVICWPNQPSQQLADP